MLSRNRVFPKNLKQFFALRDSDAKFNKYYYKIGSPMPFDVTLRDGIQAIKSEEEIALFNLDYKKKIYHEIKITCK